MEEQPSCGLINMHTKNEQGFIAITSILVIGAVVLIVGVTTSLLSINDIQSALSNRKNDRSLGIVEGCVEDALITLNETNAIPATITLPEGSCSVTINSQVGASWTFTVSGSYQNHTKRIQVIANRSSSVVITSWNEL